MQEKMTPSELRKEHRKELDAKKKEKERIATEAFLERVPKDAFFQPKSVHKPRSSGSKGSAKLYLIVCEDSVSGKCYLEDLVHDLRLSSVRVEVESSAGITGTDPGNVVKYAENRLSKDKNIQEAFVVFDGDTALLDGSCKNNFDTAVSRAESLSNMEAFVSVPCLEFWFILHYGFRDTAYERQKVDGRWTFCGPVCKDLEQKGFGGYKKSKENVFDLLKESTSDKSNQGQDQAKKRAELLRNRSENRFSNPSTDMDCLLRRLEQLKLTD